VFGTWILKFESYQTHESSVNYHPSPVNICGVRQALCTSELNLGQSRIMVAYIDPPEIGCPRRADAICLGRTQVGVFNA
jgi:hypothetical protein